MTVLEKVFAAGNAIKAGESLQDPAKWKVVQLLMNPFLVLLGVAAQFSGIVVTDAQLNSIAYGLATLAVLLNGYFTAATTKTIGLSSKGKSS
jgi:uncharacterized membrane protein